MPFKNVIKKEDAAHYIAVQRKGMRIVETSAGEAFKWLGWSTAIAAIMVVDQRTDTVGLWLVPWILAFLVSGRVNWYIGSKRIDRKRQPDGTLHVVISWWAIVGKTAVGMLLTWGVAFYLAGAIAESDLLPPRDPPVATPTVHAEAPKETPHAAHPR